MWTSQSLGSHCHWKPQQQGEKALIPIPLVGALQDSCQPKDGIQMVKGGLYPLLPKHLTSAISTSLLSSTILPPLYLSLVHPKQT